ncbi:hypothetical protein Tco_1381627 [Tanacetum coccineum]
MAGWDLVEGAISSHLLLIEASWAVLPKGKWVELHAQALTLAALAGAAVVEYYDHNTGAKSERYAKFLDSNSHKD